MVVTYETPTANLPNATFFWPDSNGNPIDFSSGWTFVLTVSQPPNPSVLRKTSGIIGSSSSPNLTIQWGVDELLNAGITPGNWSLEFTATQVSGGGQMVFRGMLVINSKDS